MTLFHFLGRSLALLILPLGLQLSANEYEQEIELTGTITEADHASYIELPFTVPPATQRISVSFEYQREAGVTIDLGIIDPQRLRGWSGGNKSHFTISETDATPSYLPGLLPTGQWKLLLGIPNANAGSQVEYRADIQFKQGPEAHNAPFSAQSLEDNVRWYRGDLHSHSGHSDGSCSNSESLKVPCPAGYSIKAARERNLDFIALTEHNTRSHFQSLRELQPKEDKLLLIPGQELTTFYGHAGVLGTTAFIDWRLLSPNASAIAERVRASNGLLIINHPGLPSGEQCMGCGWTADIDYDQVDAVEVVNGSVIKATRGLVHTPVSGMPYWKQLLAAGYRPTAVGGSDNHNPTVAASTLDSIGSPATVVYAQSLSQSDILDGIRSGRVFIDITGNGGKLELEAQAANQVARMGGELKADKEQLVTFKVSVSEASAVETIKVWHREAVLSPISINREINGDIVATYEIISDGKMGWIRAEALSEKAQPLLISNPIYLNRTLNHTG